MWVQYVCAARQVLPTPSGDRVGEPKEVPSGARHLSGEALSGEVGVLVIVIFGCSWGGECIELFY